MFHFCSVQKKITFLISFEENNRYLYRALIEQDPSAAVIILHKGKISKGFRKDLSSRTEAIPFTASLKSWLKAVYHLATSKIIIVDNYYGILSAMTLKRNVECIQIWHAAGALKTFGFADHSTRKRSRRANKRFKRVYSTFHKIVVGSDKMAGIFIEAFQADPAAILPTGVPRTDYFFNKHKLAEQKAKILKKYPQFSDKKIILYAPTYRDGLLRGDQIHLDIENMYRELKEDYILIIKTHQSVKNKNQHEQQFPGFVYDLSSYKKINHLLPIADYLITDYSSIPFEFALLEKPMIFFTYDFEEYKEARGLIPDYKTIVPGPICETTEQVITAIQTNQFDFKKIRSFSEQWNQYCDGQSSKRLAGYLLRRLEL